MTGAVAVTINTRYRSDELSFLIEDADLKVLVTDTTNKDYVDYAPLIESALPDISHADDPSKLGSPGAPLLLSLIPI